MNHPPVQPRPPTQRRLGTDRTARRLFSDNIESSESEQPAPVQTEPSGLCTPELFRNQSDHANSSPHLARNVNRQPVCDDHHRNDVPVDTLSNVKTELQHCDDGVNVRCDEDIAEPHENIKSKLDENENADVESASHDPSGDLPASPIFSTLRADRNAACHQDGQNRQSTQNTHVGSPKVEQPDEFYNCESVLPPEITSSPLQDDMKQIFDSVRIRENDDDRHHDQVNDGNPNMQDDENISMGRNQEDDSLAYDSHGASFQVQASPVLARGEAISQQRSEQPHASDSTPVTKPCQLLCEIDDHHHYVHVHDENTNTQDEKISTGRNQDGNSLANESHVASFQIQASPVLSRSEAMSQQRSEQPHTSDITPLTTRGQPLRSLDNHDINVTEEKPFNPDAPRKLRVPLNSPTTRSYRSPPPPPSAAHPSTSSTRAINRQQDCSENKPLQFPYELMRSSHLKLRRTPCPQGQMRMAISLAMNTLNIGELCLSSHTSTGSRRVGYNAEEIYIISPAFGGILECTVRDRKLLLRSGDYLAIGENECYEFNNVGWTTCTMFFIQLRQ